MLASRATAVFIALFFSTLAPCAETDAPAQWIALPTELKVSGPQVSIRAPLGFRYKPGYAMPLTVRVWNPGAAFNADIFTGEGDSDEAFRCGLPNAAYLPAQTTREFTFPVRAPAVSANLSLVIRETDPAGGGALRFRASLAEVFRPLAPEGRLILFCSASHGMLPRNGSDSTVHIDSAQLPEREWVYDSADVVVLGDASFSGAPQAALEALRAWLISGGRLVLSSSDVLPQAVSAGLLPVDRNTAAVGASIGWWTKNAGMQSKDILKERNGRPVYARLRFGLGQVVFVFPGTALEDASLYGAEILNHPVLRPKHTALPDLRIQPDAFAAFAPGSASAERQERAALWIGVGALVFCIAVFRGLSRRSRFEAAITPVAAFALLAVMLLRWFPAPEISLSRVSWRESPADNRGGAFHEWDMLEAFQDSRALTVSGPEKGSLVPLYRDAAGLGAAAGALFDSGERLMQRGIPVSPGQGALVYTVRPFVSNTAPAAGKPIQLNSRDGRTTLRLAAAPHANTAMLVRPGGSRVFLKDLQSPQGFLEDTDASGALRASLRSQYDETRAAACETAVSLVLPALLRSGETALVTWDDRGDDMALAGADGIVPEAGSRFFIESHQVFADE